MDNPLVDPMKEPLFALNRLLERHNHRGVIIGDIAASILGRTRLTTDLDAVFLLSIDDIIDFLKLAGEEGIFPERNAIDFARKNLVL